ncbi:MAG: aldehyde dehydrogenase family protein [Planctomycetota bacterium]|jgi:acyl-CoA reductase-like NAD-dependent aldehyde dehydrogenase
MSSVDAVVRRVAQQASTWRALDAARRADILKSCSDGVVAVAQEWVEQTCAAKGIAMSASLAGEEWMTGPAILLRHLRLYRDTLLRGGIPKARIQVDGKAWRAQVFPFESFDSLIFPGLRAEIRGVPGSDPTSGTLGPGGCAAVLGAGNVQSIPPLDILWQLLKENRVVVVKLNPVNAYLKPLLERAFAPLVSAGFLGFVEGGAAEGEELVAHPKIDAVHLTGAEASFRRVLDTPGVEDKQATAELGAVSPVIIVPGPWSRSDLAFQARQIAGMMLVNNGFNCNAPKLLVTARDWPLREAFLDAIRAAFLAAPKRQAWYPGAEERWARFVREYKAQVPPHAKGETPPILLPDVPPHAEQLALREEAFCAVLAETTLDATDEATFLHRAVDLVNGSVYGTLSCSIFAAPTANRIALEDAVDHLAYGSVGVNTWGGLGFALGTTTWGAFPGHTREHPESGIGVVHNTFQFDSPQNTILRGRFRPWLKPVWMSGHRSLEALGRRLVDYEHGPSLGNFARLLPSALMA